MMAELHAERERINEAILVVERLAAGTRGKRRGRPLKWMAAVDNQDGKATAPKRKYTMSPAVLKRIADAKKKRWAAKKTQAGKVPAKP